MNSILYAIHVLSIKNKNYSVWQLKSFYLIIIVFTVNFQSAMNFIKLKRSVTQLCRTYLFLLLFCVLWSLLCHERRWLFFFYRYFNNYILNEDFHDFSYIITQFKLKTWLIGINLIEVHVFRQSLYSLMTAYNNLLLVYFCMLFDLF